MNRIVRAGFLRWILLNALRAGDYPSYSLEITGTRVIDELVLSGVTLNVLLRFEKYEFSGGLDLTDAEIETFELIGCVQPMSFVRCGVRISRNR